MPHYKIEHHVIIRRDADAVGIRTLTPLKSRQEFYVNGARASKKQLLRIAGEVERELATFEYRLFDMEPGGRLRASDFVGAPPSASEVKPTPTDWPRATAADEHRIMFQFLLCPLPV